MDENLMARRDDPSFAQLSAYLPKELVTRFKVICAKTDLSQTEAMELAIKLWVEQQEQQ